MAPAPRHGWFESESWGRVLGLLTLFTGLLVGLTWVLARLAPGAIPVSVVPFFDHLVGWQRPPGADFRQVVRLWKVFTWTHLVVSLLLLLSGGLLLARRRLARLVWPLAGWGGFVLAVAAAWPREHLLGLASFGLAALKKQGAAPEDATLVDLLFATVPWWALAGAVVFVVLWVFLLVAGTVHLFRRVDLYVR